MIRRAKHFKGDPLDQARQRMVAQTGAFLSWALREQRTFPRIPRRTVASGGFSYLRHEPQARAVVASWWSMVLDEGWPGE